MLRELRMLRWRKLLTLKLFSTSSRSTEILMGSVLRLPTSMPGVAGLMSSMWRKVFLTLGVHDEVWERREETQVDELPMASLPRASTKSTPQLSARERPMDHGDSSSAQPRW
mmetsp:Transcript_21083/g.53859  ORF Transcript_21083/g.53859 Transcript_21083/m.53859 type:complete len:112 (-) Transcript_21083:210-545(-)